MGKGWAKQNKTKDSFQHHRRLALLGCLQNLRIQEPPTPDPTSFTVTDGIPSKEAALHGAALIQGDKEETEDGGGEPP
uniref:Uncharacterized protein n=1 Tax=Steinernema glaseri TaxID=37863 RepID=A0A1I7Y8J1_9BILA